MSVRIILSINDISQYQAELEGVLTNQEQLMTLLNGIPAETRKAIENILIDTLPKAIADSMDEKAKRTATTLSLIGRWGNCF